MVGRGRGDVVVGELAAQQPRAVAETLKIASCADGEIVLALGGRGLVGPPAAPVAASAPPVAKTLEMPCEYMVWLVGTTRLALTPTPA
ncbi:MAG TPA: hypothetical protein VFF19_00115 [Reyranella sp.]|nr:hypothetical protein [Reyranella sp.]